MEKSLFTERHKLFLYFLSFFFSLSGATGKRRSDFIYHQLLNYPQTCKSAYSASGGRCKARCSYVTGTLRAARKARWPLICQHSRHEMSHAIILLFAFAINYYLTEIHTRIRAHGYVRLCTLRTVSRCFVTKRTRFESLRTESARRYALFSISPLRRPRLDTEQKRFVMVSARNSSRTQSWAAEP